MLNRRTFLAALCASPLGPALAASRPVTIFAAISLKTALDQLAPELEKTAGITIRCVYASSAALARQIEQGAPADLFWSADREWMDWCIARNLMRTDTVQDLVGNQLVIVAPQESNLTTLELNQDAIAKALGSARVALGETRSVPAGRYAREALNSLNLWNVLATRLAETDNVRSALILTARGETPLGIVYKSDAQAEPRVKIVATFPETSHKPIVYPIGITREANLTSAQATIAGLKSTEAQTILRREGFSIVKSESPA